MNGLTLYILRGVWLPDQVTHGSLARDRSHLDHASDFFVFGSSLHDNACCKIGNILCPRHHERASLLHSSLYEPQPSMISLEAMALVAKQR